MQALGREAIDAEYRRLGYDDGWTFMATRESRLFNAPVAFVGLNPGGGGPGDSYVYQGIWDTPGNGYYDERWGPAGTFSPLQRQVHWWHDALRLTSADSLCAQFVPFRSPNWSSLPRKSEALAFAGRLWRGVLAVSPAALLITMGKRPAIELAALTSARHVACLATGWGKQMIDVWDTPDKRRIIGMPHPSRYTIFDRANGASALAEQSFRAATDSFNADRSLPTRSSRET